MKRAPVMVAQTGFAGSGPPPKLLIGGALFTGDCPHLRGPHRMRTFMDISPGFSLFPRGT